MDEAGLAHGVEFYCDSRLRSLLKSNFSRSVARLLVLGAVLAAGCASTPSLTPQTSPTVSPNPPSAVNLQGFPLPYRQGYADGCASTGVTEQKDATRFKSDGQYRTGWLDGLALCKKR
jgi:hypothetical protein